uniref:Uncharacterized protein n=1 Tax=Panagrolaimus sp. JU765 TaxID=591449 RepID=A0AC34Q9C3_9BILA
MAPNVHEFPGSDSNLVYSFYNDVPIGGFANADCIENQFVDAVVLSFDPYGDIPLLPISYAYTASIGGFANASTAAGFVTCYSQETMTSPSSKPKQFSCFSFVKLIVQLITLQVCSLILFCVKKLFGPRH